MIRRAALVLALAACRRPPPTVTSCAEGDLSGVWRAGGKAYHLLDHGPGHEVEVFPMWDTSRAPDGSKPALPDGDLPVYSPLRITLSERSPSEIIGTASYRVTRGTKTDRVTSRARLSVCATHSAVLSVDAPGWNDVPLRRE